MKAIELKKVASHLFKQPDNHKRNDLMHEIYAITDGLHGKDEVKSEFSKELQAYLKETKLKEIEKTAKAFKLIAQELRNNDFQSDLAKRIFALVKNVPPKNLVTLKITLEDFETLETLWNL